MHLIQPFLSSLIALLATIALMPVMKILAMHIGLLDKPNHRKLQVVPVPLVGGITIAIASFFSLFLHYSSIQAEPGVLLIMQVSSIFLIMGALDDRFDLFPSARLLIEIACAFVLAWSGIRITSFYGILGIEEIPVIAQYVLTILVITGVINAFNLMDGVDGLAGSLALFALLIMSFLAWNAGLYGLLLLFTTLIGAIAGFLRFNLSKDKVFLGDGGSLFLGFIITSSGIYLLEAYNGMDSTVANMVPVIIICIFLLPVLDSIRVYRSRIKKGVSPFQADRNHLHHLCLILGLNHLGTMTLVVMASLIIMGTSLILIQFLPITMVLIAGVVLFSLLAFFLGINKSMRKWNTKVTQMEQEFPGK